MKSNAIPAIHTPRDPYLLPGREEITRLKAQKKSGGVRGRGEGSVRYYGGRVSARNLADKMRQSLSNEGVDIGIFAKDLKSIY